MQRLGLFPLARLRDLTSLLVPYNPMCEGASVGKGLDHRSPVLQGLCTSVLLDLTLFSLNTRTDLLERSTPALPQPGSCGLVCWEVAPQFMQIR